MEANIGRANLCLLYGILVVLFAGYSHFAIAACNSEIKNAHKASERISIEWPLRSEHDDKTQYVRKIVEQFVPVIKLNMGTRDFNWPLSGKWEFFLIRDLSFNAFSIGNGKVYVTDGTFDFIETEAELAAVIAHEMAHQLIGHFCLNHKNYKTHEVGSLVQVMDNTKEIEADALAVDILQHTDFPAQAMLAVVKKMQVLQKENKQKQLRIKALENKLGKSKSKTFISSPEFQRIKHNR